MKIQMEAKDHQCSMEICFNGIEIGQYKGRTELAFVQESSRNIDGKILHLDMSNKELECLFSAIGNTIRGIR